ncbi:MAG: glycoside hydrolase family 57 protein [Candidatus Nanoperiomorbaceae bacterium]
MPELVSVGDLMAAERALRDRVERNARAEHLTGQKSLVLYLHVHQPWRLRPYSAFETGYDHNYWHIGGKFGADNGKIFRKVAEKSYLPMTKLLAKLLREIPDFRISLSITGTFIEQAEYFAPEVLDAFRDIVSTGRVEILGETYYHSLAFFFHREEFERQVKMHADKIRQIFGPEYTPTSFRNTELAYNNELGGWANQQHYRAVLAEGWEPVLGWRSPNFVYKPVGTDFTKLLMKNYKLSDDLAFRMGDRQWKEWPLTAGKYTSWLDAADGPVVNLFMDFETFGENVWADTGIFDLFANTLREWKRRPNHTFATISGAARDYPATEAIDFPRTTTWADSERDLSAWLGNRMQQESQRYLYDLTGAILATGDLDLIRDWRWLSASDTPYFMSTKYWNDGDVHAYFSPYDSPYDAFIYYMNVLRDVRYRLLADSGK